MDNNCICFSFIMKLYTLFLCFFHVQLSSIGVTLTSVRKSQTDLQFLIVIIEECVTRRHSNSLLALDATLEFLGIKGPQNPMDPALWTFCFCYGQSSCLI